jgi:predicted DNA-binding protein YlxM (UPF0122 family)
MVIKEFTVTHSFDTYRNGNKTSQFVSVKFWYEIENIEDFPLKQLQAKLVVAKACIWDAMVAGDITVEDANERLSLVKDNIEALRELKSK